ncbi:MULTISPECIES: ABC transporter permease [Vibrio]|uniref:ABC transporter permease subunit n=2 Tax=Vibrio TaxID=662 RepID=A0A7X4RWM1_9VIBR|nr:MULTISPECIES: ABC transporter permease [Vibrio]MBF9002503.1 ABC transporter permease [Vibrio nitrifigilis]MZI95349.1 ABC transporter permease subunit [Vibrio eleionomae]
MSALTRMWAIIIKEVRQLYRDRITFAMIVVIPLVQLTLFGYAINMDVRNIPAGLVDMSHTHTSRMLKSAVEASQVADFTHIYQTPKQAQYAIQSGEVRAALVIPKDVNQRMEQNRTLGQWMVDGSDSTISSAIMGLQNLPFTLFDETANQQVQNSAASTFKVALFYNPARSSAVNIVPGLLAVILSMTMVLFTSVAVVREREQGNLELLITTPVSSLELMIAKIIPYIFVGLIQVVIILTLGHFIFKVPINGEISQIMLGALLFISASLALGLLISTVAMTQLQAMQMTLFVLLPSILLSGFLTPYEAMPVAAQWVAEALPASHFMRLIRGIVLRSADLADLWKDSLWLGCFAILGVFVAAKRFKKSLD